MTAANTNNDNCNRREFVLASGLFVVGGLVSCNEFEKTPSPEAVKPKSQPPLDPISIRVRIGKNAEKVTIANNTFNKSILGNKPLKVEIKPNTKVIINGKTKTTSGLIMLHPNKNNTFDVVLHVPVEQYLPGVLAGELFAHWHPTTFAAQAVAARSYAVNLHLERITKSHFDVTDGPSSQMFLGDVTLDVAHRAVQETNGIVLRWNKKIIPAYYSACCGGLAATAYDAISSAESHQITPLQGHSGKDKCTTLKIRSWNTERSARLLRRRLNACANSMNIPSFADIRSIHSVEPSAINQHGRPATLAITCRRKKVYEVRAIDFMHAANTNVSALPNPQQKLWSSFLVGKKAGSNLELSGHGMGHGVGLCQYGAQEFAGAGESWQNILAWYYPKAEINS